MVFTSELSHVHTSMYHGSGCIPNAGLMAFKHQLAKRVAPDGIRVNMVNPGTTVTPRFARQTQRIADLSGRAYEEVEAERLERIPMGRFTTPEDIAKTVVYLVSDLSANVTGETINVDGGICESVRP